MSSIPGADPVGAVSSTLATERPQLVASLIRLTGDWDLAEDSVQDAVERALVRWPVDGLPRSPAAWLTTVARNRALDVLRRRQTERARLAERALLDTVLPGDVRSEADGDDRLRLIFTCCHPALAPESRVALTLKTVAGLSTSEIARAFLVSEPAMSQRLLRTKQKIAHAQIPYRTPAPEHLAERLDAVLAVVYLIFNEGYGRRASHLADEALRLADLLVELMPAEDEVRSLLALITFQRARRDTRFDTVGDLIPMEEQDRSRWDREQIAAAGWQLRKAVSSQRPAGPYRLQALIAQCHATAPEADATDWPRIVQLYDGLLVAQPSKVVALNRAVALGFRDGFEAGLDELNALAGLAGSGDLSGYYLLEAARADFLRRLDRVEEAREAYQAALGLAPEDGPERRALERRLTELGG